MSGDTRLLLSRSHWLSLCARSLRLPAAVALLQLCRASGCLGSSRRSPRVARRRLLHPHHASECLGMSRDSSSTNSPMPRVQVPRHITQHVAPLVVDYFAYTAHLGASARRAARRVARCQPFRSRLTSGCLSSSRGSPRIARRRLLRLAQACRRLICLRRAARLTARRTARRRLLRLTRLVIDYFAYFARSGASACQAACRRLLRLTWLVVDYFAYAACPGASARRAARRRLIRLCHASRCLGTSRSMLRGSSSTTSPTPRVRVPRHVVRLIVWLVVDYSASRRLVVDYMAYTARPGASARRAARRVAHRQLLRLAQARTPRVLVPRHVAGHVVDNTASRSLVVEYFAYTVRLALALHVGSSSTTPPHAGSLSTTLPCAGSYAAGPGASASRAARLAARR
jgi:hypothetical protein